MQLQLQKEHDSAEYYKMLIAQNENQRILIHDMKKHLQSIALLNEDNENEKIRAYIDQLMQSSDLLEFSKICDHKILNNILCRYKKVCNDSHIAFHADIRSNTTAFLSDSDVTSYSVTCWIMRWKRHNASKIPILKSLPPKENIHHLSLLQSLTHVPAIRSLQMGNLFLPNLTHRHMALVLRA